MGSRWLIDLDSQVDFKVGLGRQGRGGRVPLATQWLALAYTSKNRKEVILAEALNLRLNLEARWMSRGVSCVLPVCLSPV